MNRVLEKNTVKKILEYMNSIPGCYARKRHGSAYNPGEPDITGCLDGRRIEIEVKAPGGETTPLQRAELEKWRKAGAVVGVARSVEDAKKIIHGEA